MKFKFPLLLQTIISTIANELIRRKIFDINKIYHMYFNDDAYETNLKSY